MQLVFILWKTDVLFMETCESQSTV